MWSINKFLLNICCVIACLLFLIQLAALAIMVVGSVLGVLAVPLLLSQ